MADPLATLGQALKVLAFLYVATAIVSGVVAWRKDRNPIAWFLLALVIGPLAWLVIAAVGDYYHAPEALSRADERAEYERRRRAAGEAREEADGKRRRRASTDRARVAADPRRSREQMEAEADEERRRGPLGF